MDKLFPETVLSTSVENLMMQWSQILSQILTPVGIVVPNDDHIKETAEVIVRQFKDACLDLNSEFARTSIEWRLRHPDEVIQEEICDYESSIKRQENLLQQIDEYLKKFVEKN